MSTINPIWLEGRRRYWQRHDWQRFIRHDAHRFLTPAGIAEEKRAAEAKTAARREAEDATTAEQEAFYAEHLELRRQLADVKFDLAFRRIFRKYSPDQPRVPAGGPEGGQWTSGGDTLSDGEQALGQNEPLPTAGDQTPRSDLVELEKLANDPTVRPRIDEAWAASRPNSLTPQENGFWISRNEITGEVFTQPFASRGSADSITPGPTPHDAIAFFHTHPNRPDARYFSGPSTRDEAFAGRIGLPGLIQSHSGMYYFGPRLRSIKLR